MASLATVPIAEDELLARHVVRDDWYLKADGRMKPVAFLPYKHVSLSVTRHRDFSEHRLWGAGRCVAAKRQRPLLGRADLGAASVVRIGLRIEPFEGPGRGAKNHANIVGYPAEKRAQLRFAQELAAQSSRFIPVK